MLLKGFLFGGALIIGVCAAFAGRDDARGLVQRIDKAVFQKKSSDVWRAIPESERIELGMSPSQFHQFLGQYVVPTYAALGEPRSIAIRDGVFPGQVVLDRTYRTASGSDVHFCIDAVSGNSGPSTSDLVTTLTLSTMNVRHPRLKQDRFTYDQELRALKSDVPLLKKFGLKGFFVQDSTGRTFISWEDRIATCERKLAILKARSSG